MCYGSVNKFAVIHSSSMYKYQTISSWSSWS